MSEEKDRDRNPDETVEEGDDDEERRPARLDPRALEAIGDERTFVQTVGMPALLLGLGALIFGVIWGILVHDFISIGPGLVTVAGILLTAFGIVFGVPRFMKQLHGRGSLVVLVSLGLCVAVLLLLVGINALAIAYETRIDVTQNRHLSLSEQSLEILKGVTEDVHITVAVEEHPLLPPSFNPREVRRMLREYEAACKYISSEEVDLYKSPELKEELDIAFGGRAIVTCGEKREEVTLTSGSNEEGFTAAILRVSKPEKDVVYNLVGHGELKLEQFGADANSASTFRQALENVQMEVKELRLAGDEMAGPAGAAVGGLDESDAAPLEEVPADAKAVMILGAKTPLAEAEIDALQRFVSDTGNGGGLLIALAYEGGAPDFSEILGEYGVMPLPGIIGDLTARATFIPVTESPEGHDIANNITLIGLPMCRALEIEQDQPEPPPYGGAPPPPASDAKAVATTSNSSWLETGRFWEAGAPQPTVQATTGPYNMAVVIDTGGAPPPTPPGMAPPPDEGDGPGERLVVVGSYMMFIDQFTRNASPGTNLAFGTQAVTWLAGGKAISIDPKEAHQFSLTYSKAMNFLVSAILLVVIPFGTLFVGIVVWWFRR